MSAVLQPVVQLPSEALLTARELEVAKLVASGKVAKEVSEITGVSIHTEENDRKNIYKKLRVQGAVQLAHFMLSRDLIQNIYATQPT